MVPSPSRLTLFENNIFWSDGTKQGIMSINKYQGQNTIQVVYHKREVREPKAVKAVHGLIQLPGNKHAAVPSHT
jgi:low density lipoprotein-related protein 2